ncbi:MAG: SDR family oxidoreductase [Victivallales bacterium]|nr:SDR family oxidoreductase [Victivallales bacterium]
MKDFLGLSGKRVLVTGVSNRKSVACHIASVLRGAGTELLFSVQLPEQKAFVEKTFPDSPVFLCDVSKDADLDSLAAWVDDGHSPIYGLLHSIAFARFADGIQPFHGTARSDFVEAFEISCYSLMGLVGRLKGNMDKKGSIVAMSISTTAMAAESYGYMAPIKAALDSAVCFLAKSLSEDSEIRVNCIGASLLKTSASAGIPGYIEPYLYAESATLRKRALETSEVANAAAFLLSPASSGINAAKIVVDAGMSVNYFDKGIVSAVVDKGLKG